MMPEDEKALTIARRTRKNLDFIYCARAHGEDVEEVTQLLNSMLGMLICLREKYFHRKPPVTWEYIQSIGLTPIHVKTFVHKEERGEWQPKADSFSQLITHLRHAFAHNNFQLLGDSSQPRNQREIIGIEVWNTLGGNSDFHIWKAELSVDELKAIAYLFIDYLEKTRGHELATA